MKNSFTNKQTDLDLNGPYLSFGTQPQSVTGIGTTVGGTSGATVTMTGISTTGFNPTGTTRFNPPCIAVIDENTGSSQFSVNQDWNNFYAAHPKRQFYLMDVGGSYGDQTVKTPTGIGTGAAPITNFTKFDVNRDEGNAANTSDWFDLAGLSTLSTGSLVSLWVDSSGSMTPSNVQASLDLFLTNCSNAGINVNQSSNPNAYFEEYIEPFIEELVGDPPPANKGSVDYRWYEVGVGPLFDSATVTGTATTTLTISNLTTPNDNGRKFFLQVDYDPDTATGIGSMKITGNAPNEPFNSGIATVTVTPLVEITTQPVLTSTFPNVATDITVVASLSDSSFGDDTQYQWQLDGQNVSDGTITKTITSSETFYANGNTIDGFNGVGQYRIYYSRGIFQAEWNAGSGPNSTGSTFGGTESETIDRCAAEISTKLGIEVEVGSLQETVQYGSGPNDIRAFYSIKTVPKVVTTIVAGATTPTLTLTSNDSGIGYVARCRVTSATASNSPIVSDSQIYTVNVPSNVIDIESIKNAGNQATLSSTDLANGEITINAATSSTASDFFLHSLYAPNKDVDVEMELYGGKGDNFGNMATTGRVGGSGGKSTIRFTMQQNEEYVIAGLTEAVNSPFVYRKGALMVCVGQGGAGGQSGGGGNGGGVDVDGQAGNGSGSSTGNSRPLTGSLTNQGTFGSAFQSPTLYPGDSQEPSSSVNGGQTISCTKGVYWAQQGLAPCVDITGNSQFRLSNGTLITNSASITRGYKAGYNIIQTAGINQTPNCGKGGNGATGGNGAITLGGGAGGSGYTDGSVTVVSTQQGGSTGNAKVVIRLQT